MRTLNLVRDLAQVEAFDISQSMNHLFCFFAERRIRSVALQFSNQCIFVLMRHNCVHKFFNMLFPVVFLVLLRFFKNRRRVLSSLNPKPVSQCCCAFGSKRGDNSPVLRFTTFSRQSAGTVSSRMTALEFVCQKSVLCLFWYTFHLVRQSTTLGPFTSYGSSLCGSILGSTAVQNTVCRPSFKISPAMRPD